MPGGKEKKYELLVKIMLIIYFLIIRFEVDLEQFPTITKIEKSLELLEPFQKAHPNQQPDTPKE